MTKIENSTLPPRVRLITAAICGAVVFVWMLGYFLASVWLSQPYGAQASTTTAWRRVDDVPLLMAEQKAVARQRGYIPLWINGEHHILVNLPEEYL